MSTNMWLTVVMMLLVVILANADNYPTLQILLAGIIYLILIALVCIRIWW